jgi:hypothetical protein
MSNLDTLGDYVANREALMAEAIANRNWDKVAVLATNLKAADRNVATYGPGVCHVDVMLGHVTPLVKS